MLSPENLFGILPGDSWQEMDSPAVVGDSALLVQDWRHNRGRLLS